VYKGYANGTSVVIRGSSHIYANDQSSCHLYYSFVVIRVDDKFMY